MATQSPIEGGFETTRHKPSKVSRQREQQQIDVPRLKIAVSMDLETTAFRHIRAIDQSEVSVKTPDNVKLDATCATSIDFRAHCCLQLLLQSLTTQFH